MPTITRVELTNSSASFFAVAKPQREQWEGHFAGETGSVAGFSFDLVAGLHFFAGALEGEGRGADFPAGEDKLTLSGMNIGNTTEFDMWLHAKGVDNKPLVCIGTLDLKLGKIEGQFTVDCLDSSSCGCGGGSGHFEMNRRIVDAD